MRKGAPLQSCLLAQSVEFRHRRRFLALAQKGQTPPPHTSVWLGGEATLAPGGHNLSPARKAARLRKPFYQLNQLLRQECMGKDGQDLSRRWAICPHAGSFNPACELLLPSLPGNKCTRYLAHELHIDIARVLEVAARIARPAAPLPVRDREFYKFIRGEFIHVIRNRRRLYKG